MMKKYVRPSFDVVVVEPTNMCAGSDGWYEIPVGADNGTSGTPSAELEPGDGSGLMFE